MPSKADTDNGIKNYDVYTLSGEPIRVKAKNFEVNKEEKTLKFSNDREEWVFFAHNVAGIHALGKLTVTFGHLRFG